MTLQTRLETLDSNRRKITYVVNSGQTGFGISISKLVDGTPVSGVELDPLQIQALMKHLTSLINQ